MIHPAEARFIQALKRQMQPRQRSSIKLTPYTKKLIPE